jgi:hypothetical protein
VVVVGKWLLSRNNCPGYCRRTRAWVRRQNIALSAISPPGQAQESLPAHQHRGAPAIALVPPAHPWAGAPAMILGPGPNRPRPCQDLSPARLFRCCAGSSAASPARLQSGAPATVSTGARPRWCAGTTCLHL